MSVVRIYSSFDEPIDFEQDESICSFGVSFLESPCNPFQQTCYCILQKNHKGQHKVVLGHDGGEQVFLMPKHFKLFKKK